jgi:hypothetical protein
MKYAGAFLFMFYAVPVCAEPSSPPQTCTYESFNWNVRQQRPVNMHTVTHPYSELASDEVDPQTGCTVCLEDQVTVQVGKLTPFLVCNKVADIVRDTLDNLLSSGEVVVEVTAYRPGKTRNPLDDEGNRTGFSNHAYGAAIDINRGMNGLYDNCAQFGPVCRLIQGGAWIPGHPGVLGRDTPIVRGMMEAGFKWGGDIAGKQKDFMHFSFTGY